MITSVVSALSSMAGPSVTASAPRPVNESSREGPAPVNSADVKQAVGQMQSQLDSMNISLQFSVYGDNDNKIVVKVVDRDTGKVIREIPAKEVQALQDKMSELVGMIFDHKT